MYKVLVMLPKETYMSLKGLSPNFNIDFTYFSVYLLYGKNGWIYLIQVEYLR